MADTATSKCMLIAWMRMATTVIVLGSAILAIQMDPSKIPRAGAFALMGMGGAILLLATFRFGLINQQNRNGGPPHTFGVRNDILLGGLIALLFGVFSILAWIAAES